MQRARPMMLFNSSCSSSIGCSGAGIGSVKIPVRIMRDSVLIMRSSPVVSAIGQVEGFIDQRKIRHNVAEYCVFEQRPVLPGRIVRMAATNGSVGAAFEGNHNRPPPSFDHADSELIRLCWLALR